MHENWKGSRKVGGGGGGKSKIRYFTNFELRNASSYLLLDILDLCSSTETEWLFDFLCAGRTLALSLESCFEIG